MKQAELVFIPAPPLSHIIAAVETAKLLLERAESRLSVTVLTMNPSKDVTVDTYIKKISSSNPHLRFINVPAPERPPIPPALNFVFDFIESRVAYMREIISDLIKRQQPAPPVAGLVLDIFTTNFIDVAGEFGLPSYVFSTCGAGYLGLSRHFCTRILAAIKSGHEPPIVGADFEVTVPYFAVPVPAKVLPGRKCPEHQTNMAIGSCLMRLSEVKGIMVNTFYELEPYAIDALMSDKKAPKVYPVGPILNSRGGKNDDDMKNWLDEQPEKSVVFLCFGSMGSLYGAQVREIAIALENYGCRFLWSLRDGGAELPEGFLERTKGVGRVIGWAAQAAVLAHAAVGGFVSHCGWNSILESVWFGVPIAAFPMFAEQHLNAFELVQELGMAEVITLDYQMDMDFPGETLPEIVGAEKIEDGIRRLMAAEGGGVRLKVEEMRRKGRAAVEDGGSSYKAQALFIENVIRNIA